MGVIMINKKVCGQVCEIVDRNDCCANCDLCSEDNSFEENLRCCNNFCRFVANSTCEYGRWIHSED